MGKGLTAFLIIFFLILAVGGVIGVDIYLSYKDVQESAGAFDIGTPVYEVANNNESVTVTVTT